jgi:hypothetical protein
MDPTRKSWQWVWRRIGATDAEGHFLGSHPAVAEDLEVQVCQPGLVSTTAFVPRFSIDPLKLVTEPSGAIFGRVTEPSGKPIAGAKISFTSPAELVTEITPMPPTPCESPTETTSDAEGRYRFEPLPLSGWQGLRVLAEGHDISRVEPFEVGSRQGTPVDVVLEPTALLSGRVLDPDGRPVAGASVWASDSCGIVTVFKSDENGSYKLPCILPGTRRVGALHDDWEEVLHEIPLATGENRLDISFVRRVVNGKGGAPGPEP